MATYWVVELIPSSDTSFSDCHINFGTEEKGTGGILGYIALRTNRSSSSKSIWDSNLWSRPLGTRIGCITVLILRWLNTSTLYIWDISTLVILWFYGDLMKYFYFIKNMLQFLPVALPLELRAFHNKYISLTVASSLMYTFPLFTLKGDVTIPLKKIPFLYGFGSGTVSSYFGPPLIVVRPLWALHHVQSGLLPLPLF